MIMGRAAVPTRTIRTKRAHPGQGESREAVRQRPIRTERAHPGGAKAGRPSGSTRTRVILGIRSPARVITS